MKLISWMTTAAIALGLAMAASGCGLFYQAGTEVRAARMQDSLQAGMSKLEVHKKWGEPDIRTSKPGDIEIWSYAQRPNSNDLAATLFYTSTKEGDRGNFIDLKFQNGKLVSWAKATHTMPAKKGSGFSFGMGAPGQSPYGGSINGGGMGTPGIAHY